jgi:hypothetical protein
MEWLLTYKTPPRRQGCPTQQWPHSSEAAGLCEHLPGSVAVDTHHTVDDNANTLFERRKAVVGQRPQMPTEPLLGYRIRQGSVSGCLSVSQANPSSAGGIAREMKSNRRYFVIPGGVIARLTLHAARRRLLSPAGRPESKRQLRVASATERVTELPSEPRQ